MAVIKEGGKAPVFTASDQDGNPVSIADFKGKKVVLYFYPKDNTPTCTTQACNLRDNFSLLKRKGYVVLGISADSVKSHKKFEEKYDLPFTLLADEDQKIANQYKVWQLKQMMGHTFMGIVRTTFLIDEDGKIAKIINKPVSKNHTQEILDAWDEVKEKKK